MGFIADRIIGGSLWVFTVCAMNVGGAFILGKILPRMPNKPFRFLVLFVVGVPFGILYDYSKACLLGKTAMRLTEAFILALPIALICATLFTFWLPLSGSSNTQ